MSLKGTPLIPFSPIGSKKDFSSAGLLLSDSANFSLSSSKVFSERSSVRPFLFAGRLSASSVGSISSYLGLNPTMPGAGYEYPPDVSIFVYDISGL